MFSQLITAIFLLHRGHLLHFTNEETESENVVFANITQTLSYEAGS